MADEGVTIRLSGEPADALRAIAEVKAALDSLHDKTVRVRTETERLGRAQAGGGANDPLSDVRRVEQGRVREVDRAEREITNIMHRETRRRSSLLGDIGGGFGAAGGSLRSFLPQTGPRGFGAVGAAIGGGVALLGPLRNLLGLVGAVPAAFGAAGIAAATFATVNMGAVTKAAEKQELVQKKLAAGTITAASAQKQMKNAVVDLTAAQKSALPWAQSLNDIHDATANTIQNRLLPAIGALGRGLKANQGSLTSILGTGAGLVGRGISGIGGFLGTRPGQAGVRNLGASSNQFLGAGSFAAVAGLRAFLSVATAAQPLVKALSLDIATIAARFASWSASLRGQQALSKWFTSAEVAAKSFMHVLFNLSAIINNLATGSGAGGQGILNWLDQITNRFANWTGSAGGQKSIADGVKAVGSAFHTIVSDIQTVLPVAKAFLDTLRSIGSALRAVVPGGANTLGIALAANFATGGLLAKAGGGIARRAFGGAVGGAASGGAARGLSPVIGAMMGAGGAEGVAAGAGIGAALPIAGVIALSAAVLALTAHFAGATFHAKGFGDAVRSANAVAARAASAISGRQIHTAAEGSAINARSVAQLGALSAAQSVRFDKTQLATATGQQKIYWSIQLRLDRSSLQQALNEARKANAEVNKAAETHREDVKGQADATAVTKTHIDALNSLFNTQEKVLVGAARGVGIWKTSNQTVAGFVTTMQQQAAAYAHSDPAAAHYAATAALLARNLGRIPKRREVKITVDSQQAMAAIYNFNRTPVQNKHATITVSVVQGAFSGTPAAKQPILNPASGFGPHPATGAFFAGTYRGVDTINTKLAPGEVVLNPRQINMLGRGRIMSTLAQTGGQFFDASGYAAGGLVGADQILGTAAAYLTGAGGTSGLAGAAAKRYAGLPKRISKDTRARGRLVRLVNSEQTLIDHLSSQARGLTGSKNTSKRRAIANHIAGLRVKIRHQKASIGGLSKTINSLSGELGVVPGEDTFQHLIDDLEGQQVAATTLGSTSLAGRLHSSEVTDYQRRVRFLSFFTQQKNVRRIPDLWQAANQALVARSGELSSLTGDTGGGGTSGAADQHTQDVINALRDFTAQAVQMQAVTSSQVSLALDYLKSQVGSFARGTDYVPRTGLAMVHQGEAIIPAWQNGSSSGSAGSMAGTFKITGSDALTMAIAKAITPSVQIEMGRQTRRLTRERRR